MKTSSELRDHLKRRAHAHEGFPATRGQRGLVVAALNTILAVDLIESDLGRHRVQAYLIGKPSSKSMTDAETLALLEYLQPRRITGAKLTVNPEAVAEIRSVHARALREILWGTEEAQAVKT